MSLACFETRKTFTKSFVLGPRVAKPSVAFSIHRPDTFLLGTPAIYGTGLISSLHSSMHESLGMRHDSFRGHWLTHLTAHCEIVFIAVHDGDTVFSFQIFYPTTTDLYDRKNMPRVIYCIHALR